MDEIPNKFQQKKKRASLSSLSLNSQNPQTKFVFLINNLSSDIKKFYISIKQCLNTGKENIFKNNDSSLQTYDLIDKYLVEFIIKAKEIFKRMKYMQKINIIQQEMNNNNEQNQNQNTNININNNRNNIYTKSNHENKIINKKKVFDEEVYIPSLCNNTNTSFNINKFFHKVNIEKNKKINERNERNDNIKSLNNSFKDIQLINKYDYNLNNESKNKNHNSANKLIYNNYNRKHNNLKRNNNTKSVINLRKKIIFDKKPEISSLGLSHSHGLSNINTNINSNINSNNISLNNLFQTKKEIYDNLNVIISLLKELRLIKGNIFTKSLEAEKHKKVLKKIYNELLKLIKNIFKDNNLNLNNSIDIFNKDDKYKNNSSYNLSYHYKTVNNSHNKDKNNHNNQNINYKKEIKYRDLIIQQLKDELNTKSQKNFNLNENNNINKEENSNQNKAKKIISELEEKINKNQKKNLNHIEIINKRYIELEKENENILIINEELKNRINMLNQELDIAKKNIYINPLFKNLITQNFSFYYPSPDNISEKTQKIIDDLNNEINTYKEQDNKSKEEITKLNEEINKNKEEINKLNEEVNKNKEEITQLNDVIKRYKDEISQLNQKHNENIEEKIQLKENIENLNNNIEKYKKLISYQEEEIKNLKNESNSKPEKEVIHKSLSFKESIKESLSNNIINTEEKEKKNKKRNISKINEYQIEQDKIYLKYELLKNDYDKLNSTLMQKQKLLDNYSKISRETTSKTNIDEQILELMSEHKKEIEALTEKYNKNILTLKMNLPSPYSPATHTILIDKRYAKYDLKWYLLTVLTEQEKNYENTFWVPEIEMKPILDQFNIYKTEKELEDEKFDNLYKMQEKWIKQLDEKEKMIEALREKVFYYENNNSGN